MPIFFMLVLFSKCSSSFNCNIHFHILSTIIDHIPTDRYGECDEYEFSIHLGKFYLMQKHLWCKKVQPSKMESYLEVNA